MTLKQIIERFRTKKPKPTDEEIQKRLEERKEQAIVKAGKLKHLIKEKTGWTEFCGLLQEYIDACYMEKLNTRMDIADEKTLDRIKYLDRDIYILNWVLRIPQQYIEQTERKPEDERISNA